MYEQDLGATGLLAADAGAGATRLVAHAWHSTDARVYEARRRGGVFELHWSANASLPAAERGVAAAALSGGFLVLAGRAGTLYFFSTRSWLVPLRALALAPLVEALWLSPSAQTLRLVTSAASEASTMPLTLTLRSVAWQFGAPDASAACAAFGSMFECTPALCTPCAEVGASGAFGACQPCPEGSTVQAAGLSGYRAACRAPAWAHIVESFGGGLPELTHVATCQPALAPCGDSDTVLVASRSGGRAAVRRVRFANASQQLLIGGGNATAEAGEVLPVQDAALAAVSALFWPGGENVLVVDTTLLEVRVQLCDAGNCTTVDVLRGARYVHVGAAAIDSSRPQLFLYDRRGLVFMCDFTWPESCVLHLSVPQLSGRTALAALAVAGGLVGCGPSGLFELTAEHGARQLLATAGNCTALAASNGWLALADARSLFLYDLERRAPADVLVSAGAGLYASADSGSAGPASFAAPLVALAIAPDTVSVFFLAGAPAPALPLLLRRARAVGANSTNSSNSTSSTNSTSNSTNSTVNTASCNTGAPVWGAWDAAQLRGAWPAEPGSLLAVAGSRLWLAGPNGALSIARFAGGCLRAPLALPGPLLGPPLALWPAGCNSVYVATQPLPGMLSVARVAPDFAADVLRAELPRPANAAACRFAASGSCECAVAAGAEVLLATADGILLLYKGAASSLLFSNDGLLLMVQTNGAVLRLHPSGAAEALPAFAGVQNLQQPALILLSSGSVLGLSGAFWTAPRPVPPRTTVVAVLPVGLALVCGAELRWYTAQTQPPDPEPTAAAGCRSGTYPRALPAGGFECPACPPGFACDGPPQPAATGCPPGTYWAGALCEPCLRGSYCPGNGSSVACPLGADTPAPGAADLVDCACAAPYAGSAASGCVLCGANATPALLAVTGAGGEAPGTACVCRDGFYTATNSASGGVCVACPPDYYCFAADAVARLVPCPAGSSSPAASARQTDCRCRADFYRANSSACEPCPPGAGRALDAPACACRAGFYASSANSSAANSSTCRLCPPGSFCPGDGALAPCPPFSASAAGAAAAAECVCERGRTNTSCALCPSLHFCPAPDTPPVPCPEHSMPGAGVRSRAAQCEPLPGFFLRDGLFASCPTTCNGTCGGLPCACAPGRFNDGAACVPCPTGSFCLGPRPPIACEPPLVSPPGASAASDCRPARCPPLTARANASAPCAAAAGAFCGPAGCQVCPADSYCPPGSSAPLACPWRRRADIGSGSAADCRCGPGYAYNSSVAACYVCPTDAVCTGASNAAWPCPPGTSTLGRMMRRLPGDCVPAAGLYVTGRHSTAAFAVRPCPPGYVCLRGAAAVPCTGAGCSCRAGFYAAGNSSTTECQACPPGADCSAGAPQACPPARACPAGLPVACPPGAEPLANATACACAAGFYTDGGCRPCPPGFSCPWGARAPALCPRDHYCPAGSAAPQACVPLAQAPSGASSVRQCLCRAGTAPGPSFSAPQCAPCPADSFCEGGGRARPCDNAGRAFSAPGAAAFAACRSLPGYFFASRQQTAPCGPNYYCDGSGGRSACPPGSGHAQLRATNASACVCLAPPCSNASVVVVTYSTYAPGTFNGSACAPGRYCPGGGEFACPADTSSAPGAADIGACECAPGLRTERGLTAPCGPLCPPGLATHHPNWTLCVSPVPVAGVPNASSTPNASGGCAAGLYAAPLPPPPAVVSVPVGALQLLAWASDTSVLFVQAAAPACVLALDIATAGVRLRAGDCSVAGCPADALLCDVGAAHVDADGQAWLADHRPRPRLLRVGAESPPLPQAQQAFELEFEAPLSAAARLAALDWQHGVALLSAQREHSLVTLTLQASTVRVRALAQFSARSAGVPARFGAGGWWLLAELGAGLALLRLPTARFELLGLPARDAACLGLPPSADNASALPDIPAAGGCTAYRGAWRAEAAGGALSVRPAAFECAPCPAGHVCAPHTAPQACPPFTRATLDACVCDLPGTLWDSAACVLCPPDFFCPGDGATRCPPGRAAAAGASTVEHCVVACGPGSELRLEGCRPCPADHYCPSGTDALPCLGMPAGAASCACAPGYYTLGAQAFAPCPAGSFCPGNGSRFACPVATFSAPGAAACVADAPPCSPCAPGQARAVAAQTRDLLLTAPQARTNATALLGLDATFAYWSDGLRSFRHHLALDASAPVDNFTASGSDCLAAALYGPVLRVADASCAPCPADHFCAGASQPASACPRGTTAPPGANSSAACACRAGLYRVNASGAACQACPPNSVCASGAPVPCPAGTTATAKACDVPRGFVLTNGSLAPCPANSFCRDGSATQCPPNTHSAPGAGRSTDCVCNDGLFADHADVAALELVAPPCLLCPADSFCTGGVAEACPALASAPPGSRNLSSCVCRPGRFGPPAACALCGPQHYCPGGARLPCPPGSRAATPAATSASECVCVAGLFRNASGLCEACPANATCPGDGSAHACAPPQLGTPWGECACPPDTLLLEGGACGPCPPGFSCTRGLAWRNASNASSANNSTASAANGTCAASCSGYLDDSGACGPCPPGRACAGGELRACARGARETAEGCECPPATAVDNTSGACEPCGPRFRCANGSRAPRCAPGLFQNASGLCEACTNSSFCPGDDAAWACPAQHASAAPRAELSDCRCVAGLAANGTASCAPCPAGFYCPGGGAAVGCPPHAWSLPGAAGPCLCEPFYAADALVGGCRVDPALPACRHIALAYAPEPFDAHALGLPHARLQALAGQPDTAVLLGDASHVYLVSLAGAVLHTSAALQAGGLVGDRLLAAEAGAALVLAHYADSLEGIICRVPHAAAPLEVLYAVPDGWLVDSASSAGGLFVLLRSAAGGGPWLEGFDALPTDLVGFAAPDLLLSPTAVHRGAQACVLPSVIGEPQQVLYSTTAHDRALVRGAAALAELDLASCDYVLLPLIDSLPPLHASGAFLVQQGPPDRALFAPGRARAACHACSNAAPLCAACTKQPDEAELLSGACRAANHSSAPSRRAWLQPTSLPPTTAPQPPTTATQPPTTATPTTATPTTATQPPTTATQPPTTATQPAERQESAAMDTQPAWQTRQESAAMDTQTPEQTAATTANASTSAAAPSAANSADDVARARLMLIEHEQGLQRRASAEPLARPVVLALSAAAYGVLAAVLAVVVCTLKHARDR